MLLTACGGSGARTDSQDPAIALRRAAEATADARSFEVELTGGVTIVYQAPDRFEMVEEGAVSSASPSLAGGVPPSAVPARIVNIYVGTTRYRSHPTEPSAFTTEELAADANSPSDLLHQVQILRRAENVIQEDSRYRFRLSSFAPRPGASGVPAEGEAEVAGGYVRTLSIRYDQQGFPRQLSFMKINAAPSVEPPPPSALRPY